jgi:hypothetical protein
MRRMMQTRAAERGRTRRKKETHAIKRAGHRRGRCALLPNTSKWTFRHAACGQHHESIQPRNWLGEPATTSFALAVVLQACHDKRLAPRARRAYIQQYCHGILLLLSWWWWLWWWCLSSDDTQQGQRRQQRGAVEQIMRP